MDDPLSAVTPRTRQKIRGLKLLAVQNPIFLGLFTSVSGDLIWLRFSGRAVRSSIPPTLSLKNLRVLEVHGVRPQDICYLFEDREPPSQLSELTVAYKRECEIGGFPGLGRLDSKKKDLSPEPSRSNLLPSPIIIRHWFQPWLGKLNFQNLGKIVLQNVLHMETLPIKFEEATNLRHVDLSGCKHLKVLPPSFTEKLLQLQFLALADCSKLVLRSLGKISTLEYLDYEGCSMLNELPRGTEDQKHLRYLSAVGSELRELPHSLQQLKNLEELHIGSPHLTELPSSLYTLSSLTDLTLFGCINLFFIDNSIEKLMHLERFRIYKCGVKTLPERIAWKRMKILDVQACQMYLHRINIGNSSGYMQAGSSHNHSSCLTDLIVRDSYISGIHITGAESLFPNLEIIDLSSNIYLTEIGRLPDSLIILKLINCSELTTLGDLSHLAGLKVLDISGCVKLRTLNLEGLKSIEVIKADKCPNIYIFFHGPKQLKKLSYLQISVPSFVEIMTCAPNISTAIISGSVKKMKDINEMDTVTDRFEGVKVRRIFESDHWEGNVKPKGAILLYLVTDQNSNIEVTFFGHVYNLHSSSSSHPVHLLLWTEDSEVYKDYKSSIETVQNLGLSKGRVQKGWMVEAKDSVTSKWIISYLLLNFKT